MNETTDKSDALKAQVADLNVSDLIHLANTHAQANDVRTACELYVYWILSHPDDAFTHAALFNLSTLQSSLGNSEAAEQALEKALQLKPDFIPAYINLGRLVEGRGEKQKALELWMRGANQPMIATGVSLDHMVTLLKQLARVLLDEDKTDQAEETLQRCISIAPDQEDALEQYLALRMRELRWPVHAPVDPLSPEDMLRRLHPLSMAAFTDDPMIQLACGRRYSRRLTPVRSDARLEYNRRDAPIDISNRRIRVGYLSSDLRDHAIGYLLGEYFELEDRDAIESFTYLIGKGPTSDISKRIENAVDHWHDMRGQDDDAVAAQIAADEIDILVDVNGHTKDAQLGVMAHRPAPIIVNWLGFPGTMGSPYHHYIIADEFIIPPEHAHYFSERVMRLPCYQANDRRRVIASAPTRNKAGLPEDKFVFCCFNALHKINRFTLERWAQILKAVPNSVLWLLDCTKNAKRTLATFFKDQGVDTERLFYAEKLQNPHHLARYPLADLFLDTLPYGAHTTASDALFMGVPVLTLSGRCFAARVCGSLVSAAGMDDLVVHSPEDFVTRAIALAQSPDKLAEVTQRLKDNRSSCVLFDQPLLARSMRDLFREMVAQYQAGDLPQPDLANLDQYLDAGVSLDHENIEMTFASDPDGMYREVLTRIDRQEPLFPDSRLWKP